MKRTLILGPNPALDLTVEVPMLSPGALNRADDSTRQYAGKAWNVTRQCALLGAPADYLSFDLRGTPPLALEGVRTFLVPTEQPLRINVKVKSPTETTEINTQSPPLEPEALEAMAATLDTLLPDYARVVLSGSLPKGWDLNYHEQLLGRIRRSGAELVVDTSGKALIVAARAGASVIKINGLEWEAWAEASGVRGGDFGMRASAMAALYPDLQYLIVTHGPDGVEAWCDGRTYAVPAIPVEARGVIGAGDSFLAALLWRGLDEPQDALRWAVATAAETVRLSGTDFAKKDHVKDRLKAMVDPDEPLVSDEDSHRAASLITI